MRLRVIELETADGLPPLPMHTSWVRGGILVVGMDNEFHVYTQWRGGTTGAPASSVTAGSADSHMGEELTTDKRTLTEANLASMASSAAMTKSYKSMSNFKSSLSMPSSKHTQTSTSASKRELWRKPGNSEEKGSLARSDSTTSLSVMHDFGLFEAARLANPVLPQYHPEQLKALLSFGKIRRVKAILAHLLRCIIGTNNMQASHFTVQIFALFLPLFVWAFLFVYSPPSLPHPPAPLCGEVLLCNIQWCGCTMWTNKKYNRKFRM